MKYAAVSIRSKQYLVSEGDELYVQGTNFDPGEVIVLLMVDEGKVTTGFPNIKDAVFEARILAESVKGEKISVTKYKAKSRYRKKIGARPVFTRVKVEKLSLK